MEVLRVENLCKTYGTGDTRVDALKDVSFSVDKGEFVAIIGPSGSGKSTLLHILGGVDRPTSGRVIIDGTPIYELNETKLAIFRRRQIGLIYQFYNLLPVLNVKENLTLPLLLDGQKPDEEYLKELTGVLGLSDRISHLPNQLSGGQQQRVSIGRALINHPAIVLADEPTGNLDPETARGIMQLLEDINARGTTIVMATHARDIVDEMQKRVVTLNRGHIIRDVEKGGYVDEA